MRGGATLGLGVAVGSLLGYWVCRRMQARTHQPSCTTRTCACGGGDVDAARAAVAASKPLLNPGLYRSTPHARALLAAGGCHEATVADEELISHCYTIRDKMRAPAHSNFRVVAILTVTLDVGDKGSGDPPKLCHVVGTNHEIGIIGGSICAERTALGKLQLMEYDDLVAVHIVTDAADPITPGTLCRQYMSEVGSASTRVVVDAAKGRIITTLGELYPCPYLYQGVPRHNVVSYARTCAQHAQAPASVLEAPEVELLRKVVDASRRDAKNALHPIRFGGGALFSDGSVEVTWQSKALEYGSTAGVFTKLLHSIESKVDAGLEVKLLVQADQFGVMHAPNAQDRALLAEHGLVTARVALHRRGDGDGDNKVPPKVLVVGVVTVSDLVPMTPAMEGSLG